MAHANVILVNRLGLHARAAAKIVKLAGNFESSISLTRTSKERRADARSILGILELGAKEGTELMIEANGNDDEAAIAAISELIKRGFDELY